MQGGSRQWLVGFSRRRVCAVTHISQHGSTHAAGGRGAPRVRVGGSEIQGSRETLQDLPPSFLLIFLSEPSSGSACLQSC